MKDRVNRTYTYCSDTEIRLDKETDSIKYISKNEFKKAVANGLKHSIAGRTRLKSPNESKGSGNGILNSGEHSYTIDSYKYRHVKGYIPVGDDTYLEYVGVNMLAVFFSAIVLITAIVAGIWFFNSRNNTILTPDSTDTETTAAQDEDSADFELYIELPDGSAHFDGTVTNPDDADNGAGENSAPYTGQASLKVTMLVNDEPHVIADYDADVDSGVISDSELDFTILDFEIQQGFYDGTMDITYPDGSTTEKTVEIIVTETNGGTMEIGFSPDVTVDLNSGAITCDYEPDKYDTHQTVVELVLVNAEEEYVLAESDPLNPGDILTSMTLDSKMAKRLTTGQYSGYMRLSFYSDANSDAAASIQTNINVNISVQ